MMLALTLIVPTAAYLVAAVLYYRDNNPPMAVTFAGYALANCGFIWGLQR